MKVIYCNSYEEMSLKAADIVVECIKNKPDAVLGLATGETPIGMYKSLIDMYTNGEVDFAKTITFNLDEYYGLPATHPQSYSYYMNNTFFNHINIDKSNIHIPNGESEDYKAECKRYDVLIEKSGGIDLQVLGIGRNGHIGFNEPDTSLNSNTHLTKLTKDTVDANSRFFDSIDEVPKYALTMGLSSILKAKKIILLISGRGKAEVAKKVLEPYITTNTPASFLQLHNNVHVILDEEAASCIEELLECC